MHALRPVLPALALALAVAVLVACSADEANPYDGSNDDPYPNTNLALIPPGGGTQRQPAMALVNRTHSRHLEWSEGEAIPSYRHPYLGKDPFTAWAVMPNEDMKELFEGTLEPAGIFDLSKPFDLQQLGVEGWPKKWAIVTEHDGVDYVFYDPKEYDAAGKPLMNIKPEQVRAASLFSVTKTAMVHAINFYPGVNQTTQRGYQPQFRGPGNN